MRHEDEPDEDRPQDSQYGNGSERQKEAEGVGENPPGHDVAIPATENPHMVQASEQQRERQRQDQGNERGVEPPEEATIGPRRETRRR